MILVIYLVCSSSISVLNPPVPTKHLFVSLLQTITGDHLEEVAEMIVSKFGVNGDAVFLDLDGEFVPFGG